MKTQCCIILACEHCQVKSSVTGVITNLISSSVLSSDGHLKPACVCKFNLGSLHVIMKTVIICSKNLQPANKSLQFTVTDWLSSLPIKPGSSHTV